MKKIRGWHDAVFRLGQETHQIPFRKFKANSLSIALKVPFGKSKC